LSSLDNVDPDFLLILSHILNLLIILLPFFIGITSWAQGHFSALLSLDYSNQEASSSLPV
jgi:hypothetical protein